VKSSAALPHSDDLDALRGIAIFGVLMTHTVSSLHMTGNDLPFAGLDITAFLNTGGLGVQLFFLLSGYLLTITESRRAAAGTATLGGYLRRRVLRLVPAYYLSLLIYLALALWRHTYQSSIAPAVDLLSYLSFLHAVVPGGSNINATYWSLTSEVVFYALLPLLLRYAPGLRLRLVLYLASLVLAGVMYYRYATTLQFDLLFHPFAHLHVFLAGSLLASLAERRERGARWSLPEGSGDFLLLLALGGLTLNAYLVAHSPAGIIGTRVGAETLVAVGFAGFVLGSRIYRLVLALPGLATLGRISYSIFLFHALAVGFAEQSGAVAWLRERAAAGTPVLLLNACYLAAVLAIVVPAGLLTYTHVELPGMRGFQRARLATAAAVA
jgi:peptidoglycan/LPS O-acetylase OafA/YrhL